ncbi:MAG: hypothetical protein Q3976_09220 [Corynebacterium sp.]|nr:hypothetical protein [Corynebacterium sp.]
MRLLLLECDTPDILQTIPVGVEVHRVSAIPTRKELRVVDAACREILPEDPTPSLDEIMAQPDVPFLGEPQFAPQPIEEPLRIIVHGSDAALSAVLTRLMRADNLWAEVGFVPSGTSTVAAVWNLPTFAHDALAFALDAAVVPKPLIRDDAGVAVAATATMSNWEGNALTGEIIVDSTTLARHEATKLRPRTGVYGALLTSTVDAPGVAGWMLKTSLHPAKKHFGRKTLAAGMTSGDPLFGRAMQAGGVDLQVRVDGVSRKRPVRSATFYRHLRDLQSVRPVQ